MASSSSPSNKTIDGLLKAMLVLARTVDYTLESGAVATAVGKTLSPSKVQILRLLGRRDTQTASQIARYLAVSKPAVSQIIDTMVRAKLVNRRTAKDDRREVNLSLTAKGQRYCQNIICEQRQSIKDALKQSRNSSTDRWLKTLQEVTEALAKADKTFDQHCLQCGAHADTSCVLSDDDGVCSYAQHEAQLRKRAEARQQRK